MFGVNPQSELKFQLPMKKIDKLILVHSIIKAKNSMLRAIHLVIKKSTVKFIKYLQYKYKNRKIILIWDGASYHKYGEFRDSLLELNGEKEPDNLSITCVLFAPNAPQQNPVEDIW
jgi:transposase